MTDVNLSTNWLLDRRVALSGKLAAVSRREAMRLVCDLGGTLTDDATTAEVIVHGANQPGPPRGREDQEVITEHEFWQRLGVLGSQSDVRRLYTVAMLAGFIGAPLSLVRRWQRCGLLTPAREVHRLAYFDFSDVAIARRLKELHDGGASIRDIERAVAELRQRMPASERPLAELATAVVGKQLLLWHNDELVELSGQRRLNFPAEEAILTLTGPTSAPSEELLSYAAQFEEADDLAGAAEMLRAALAAGGPRADINFQLAELLYRLGEMAAARERYYMAIELDEDFVEARANLGCLLADAGQHELALAALQGALSHHPDYADAHFHLARLLDELGRAADARAHWERFAELSPESPWLDK